MKMWAVYDREKATYHHVYRNENIVRMCSPDGFKSREDRGEGEVVQVEISHLTTVAPDSKKLSPMSWPNFGDMPKTTNCPTCGTICRR